MDTFFKALFYLILKVRHCYPWLLRHMQQQVKIFTKKESSKSEEIDDENFLLSSPLMVLVHTMAFLVASKPKVSLVDLLVQVALVLVVLVWRH